MDDECGPAAPFHPADVLVSLMVFGQNVGESLANLFSNFKTDAQAFADTNRDRRAMRTQTLADIRSLS